ncbi:MAG: 50S ribosomal protein L3 [Nitrospira sp.]|nr:50S ribosomal protein L3 [Candidatus Brocadiales bacterium]MBL7049329.1 50S ribosomal protein L3 [Nitrospira sp.]
MKGIIGKKLGMTQIFNEDGRVIPVTVLEAGPVRVVQKKELAKDGYAALQLGYDENRKEKNVNKARKGHFKKANVPNYRVLKELKMEGYEVGEEITLDIFEEGEFVKITGTSIGKGFQGVMKRYNFSGGPASHGSMFKRAPGAIGMGSTPGRVFKGKKMPGQMGNVKSTVDNLVIVALKNEQGLMLVRGAVPGAIGSYVVIKSNSPISVKDK